MTLVIRLVAAFSSDPGAEIRFSVACALGSFPNDPLSGNTLVTLMEDVRDWATFGVGISGDQDSVELRYLNRRSLGRRRVSKAKASTMTCSLTSRIGFRAL